MKNSPNKLSVADFKEQAAECIRRFQAERYCVVRRALDYQAAALVRGYVSNLDKYHLGALHDEPELHSKGSYADPLGESVLEQLQPVLESHTGLRLIPTYSYTRVYGVGAELKKHTDRPSCEISCTLYLGGESVEGVDATRSDWPIFVEVDGRARTVELEPGDIMIYRGIDVPHWREAFTGLSSAHMFLHFVDADGPHTDMAYDGRASLGAPPAAKAPVRDRLNESAKPKLADDKGEQSFPPVHPPKDGKLSIDEIVSNPNYFFAGYDWKNNAGVFYCIDHEIPRQDCEQAKHRPRFNVPINVLVESGLGKHFEHSSVAHFVWSTGLDTANDYVRALGESPGLGLYYQPLALSSLAFMKKAIDEKRTNCSFELWQSLLKIALIFQSRTFSNNELSLTYELPTSNYIIKDVLALDPKYKGIFCFGTIHEYLVHAFANEAFLRAAKQRVTNEFSHMTSMAVFCGVDFNQLTLPKVVALHWLYLIYSLPENAEGKLARQMRTLEETSFLGSPETCIAKSRLHLGLDAQELCLDKLIGKSELINTFNSNEYKGLKKSKLAGEAEEKYQVQVDEAINFAMNILAANPISDEILKARLELH